MSMKNASVHPSVVHRHENPIPNAYRIGTIVM
jgi:hypothetical protein